MKSVHYVCLLLSLCLTAGCGGGAKPRLPYGFVDSPPANQVVSGRFTAFGWALSEDRIKKVSVYADRVYLADCRIGVSRPDVTKVYPGFPDGDNSGWNVDLDLSSLPEGKHELVFQAESAKGAIRDLGAVPVTVGH